MKNQEQGKVLTSDEINYLIYRYLQECGECWREDARRSGIAAVGMQSEQHQAVERQHSRQWVTLSVLCCKCGFLVL